MLQEGHSQLWQCEDCIREAPDENIVRTRKERRGCCIFLPLYWFPVFLSWKTCL